MVGTQWRSPEPKCPRGRCAGGLVLSLMHLPGGGRRGSLRLEEIHVEMQNSPAVFWLLLVTRLSVTWSSGTVPQAPWGNRPVWEGCWKSDSNWLTNLRFRRSNVVSIRLLDELNSFSLHGNWSGHWSCTLHVFGNLTKVYISVPWSVLEEYWPLEPSEPRWELCLHFHWFRNILGEDYELSPFLFVIFRDINLEAQPRTGV